MNNHTAGWQKAIAASNARIEADEKTLDDQATPATESASDKAVREARERSIEIVTACLAAGASDRAGDYIMDDRPLDEILKEIKGVELLEDCARQVGLEVEFRNIKN